MNKKGFTLIELLVVIAIIGLLSTLAVVSLGNARTKSRDAKRLSDIKQIQNALEMYFNDRNTYPNPTAVNLSLGESNSNCLGMNGFVSTTLCVDDEFFMKDIPLDPLGEAYIYNGGVTTYTLRAVLESGGGGFASGPVTATPNGLEGTR
ncbi:MAG TPA: prepilin-type N-terminal cleavage/methylation domain-containing protein [Candidatus Magasanikbacteria bacterium]|nr:prepilin-type N-terminal cleavage/methylation domain-containing protein [Candidatus Magasanikbacteria bacterium]